MSQTQWPVAAQIPPTRVELLLRIRRDMQSRRSGPYVYIGMPDVERVECLLPGYSCGVGSLGFSPGQDGLFGDWLREVKKAWPGEGWAAAYLREFNGDHTQALRKYVDFAAEFRDLTTKELAAMPWGAEERKLLGQAPSLQPMGPPVLTLDELLEIRRVGRIGLYIGYARVERLAGYVDGYRLGLSLAGLKDEEYTRFERWLQDSGSVPPGRTWEMPLLQTAGGDHEAAIHRFLERAADFRALIAAP
jgi:hypothetical protein